MATNESIRKIIKEEKMEDREIKATSRNLIIHGIVEDVKDTQEGRERDKLFVGNIMSSSMGLKCENQEDAKNRNIYDGETRKE